MRGSRIQAIVRELNNEKIDIVNYSEQVEILVSRALSPAKPVQLFIDDEKNYCLALFDDDGLDAAIGRNGMNINLASKITDYRIDAHGVKQYERIQEDQKSLLTEIDGVDQMTAESLNSIGVTMVSELLDADMDDLLSAQGIADESLDEIYEAVQSFIEREVETNDEEVESVDLALNAGESILEQSSETDSNDETAEPEPEESGDIDSVEEINVQDTEDDSVAEDEPVTKSAE
jgi:N utilization substance protein A